MSETFTPDEVDRRRDRVVRIMLATPPKPRKKPKNDKANVDSDAASPAS